MDLFDNEDTYMFPLTENLSNSYVDTSKLISYLSNEDSNRFPIGMDNFRAKKALLTKAQSLPNQSTSPGCEARRRWRDAAFRIRTIKDPWAEFELDMYPAETAIRHRYNAIKKVWIKDECTVKIETKKFANGAMRACFRMKKLSNFVHKESWQHASNYVAKCYMDAEIPRERYFDDVKLQMDAKLWAEIYNRHNPPKKIDMFQVSIIEFQNRPGSPLFHLEHFIEGNYIKYNSNSGFVEDSNLRSTPQAFSHFTFECSNHDLIVVDVQGVGDLYTDPQIHTAKGDDYGDGNLGIKGFALFFSSHVCNKVCKSLGLTEFDLASSELDKNSKIANCVKNSVLTRIRGNEEVVVGSPSSFGEYFRKRVRYRSENSVCSDENNNTNDLPYIYESEGYESASSSPMLSPNSLSNSHSISRNFNAYNSNVSNPIAINSARNQPRPSRIRTESNCLDSAFSVDEAASYFDRIDARKAFKPRASCVHAEKGLLYPLDNNDSDDEDDSNYDYHLAMKMKKNYNLLDEDDSVLGKIHLELCKYHEMGRFVEDNQDFDQKAAMFHLRQAADLGIKEALSNIAKMYLQLPHDILSSHQVENNDDNMTIGFEYMIQSAEKEEKNSIFYLSKAYDTGVGLTKDRSIDWAKSVEYYKKVLQLMEEEGSSSEDAGFSEVNSDCDPSYVILARIAEMNLKGGVNLARDPSEASSLYTEAAEKAMQYGKGRIANKYYMLSEEASALADD